MHGANEGRGPLRAVLDTNVVVSALRFSGGPAGHIRQAWRLGAFVPLASGATTMELVRVLAYPKFKLTAQEQESLLGAYLPFVQVVNLPGRLPALPACRDPNDVPFMHLAVAGKADALVSGDKDLLALAGAPGLCPVLAVDAFLRSVLSGSA